MKIAKNRTQESWYHEMIPDPKVKINAFGNEFWVEKSCGGKRISAICIGSDGDIFSVFGEGKTTPEGGMHRTDFFDPHLYRKIGRVGHYVENWKELIVTIDKNFNGEVK